MKKLFVLCAMAPLFAAAVFAEGKAELVNEKSFSLAGISAITVEYGSGRVVFMEGAGDALMFREYLSADKPQYYARSSASGGIITVETGRRPWLRHLRARLEVYLPRSFEGDCRVSVGSGGIEAETDIAAAGTMRLAVSSGTTRLRKVSARNIGLRAQSGSIHAAGLYGDTDMQLSSGSLYVSEMRGGHHRVRLSSGSAEIGAASGGGSFSSSSGNIKLKVSELSGDLSFDISSGSLDLTLPRDAAFYLDAETSSGGVSVTASGDSFSVKNRASVLRPVGDNPEFTIRAAVSSGNIRITR